jgi:hypothetical protein
MSTCASTAQSIDRAFGKKLPLTSLDLKNIPIPLSSVSELPAGCLADWPEVVVSISQRKAKPTLPKAGCVSFFLQ